MHSPCMTRAGLYGTLAEKIFGSNNGNSANRNSLIASSSSNEQSSWRTHEPKNDFKSIHESSTSIQTRPNPLEPILLTLSQATPKEHTSQLTDGVPSDWKLREWKSMKRKASESDLDLNLSLKVPRMNDIEKLGNEEVESDLSLSLYSPSSSSKQLINMMKERPDGSKEHARRTSTLDLTL